MSYAQRPMGDYKTYGYAGDPGFLSSLWRGVKKIARPIIGAMVGGPVGAVITGATIGGAVVKATTPARPAPPPPPRFRRWRCFVPRWHHCQRGWRSASARCGRGSRPGRVSPRQGDAHALGA